VLPVLLSRRSRSADQSSSGQEPGGARHFLVEIRVGQRIGAKHIDLASAYVPFGQPDVSRLCLKRVLVRFPIFDAFCNKVLPKLERPVTKMNVEKAVKTQQGHEGGVEFALGQRINVVSDNVVEH
jgi:hypothetical protein